MPANPVQAAAAVARGLRSEFISTYRRAVTQVEPRLSKICRLGVPSDKLEELYAYPESPVHPSLWARGDDISERPFRYVSYTVENFAWSGRISWHADDEADDQTGSLVSQARDLASGFALLPERLALQIITQTADPNLLPALPLAPDGAAIFSALDGAGAARFGVAGGNLLAGNTTASVANIQQDLYRAVAQFRLMQDTEGQPLHSPATLDQELIILYGSANEQMFRQAFEQNTVQGNNAGISNVILNSGMRVSLWSTSRITDNDWFVFASGVETKPLFEQVRKPLSDNVEDFNNSDRTRTTKIKAYQADSRLGMGLNVPYSCIQINN